MTHFRPFMSLWRNRDFSMVADINGNLFGLHPFLLVNTRLRGGRDTLSLPVLGCLPRPRKRPGGSMRKFPTFSFRPSRRQVLYLASSSSFSFLRAAFSSLVSFFFSSLLVSKYSHMGLKSHFSNFLIWGAYPINIFCLVGRRVPHYVL